MKGNLEVELEKVEQETIARRFYQKRCDDCDKL